jgi:hypothetical protein
MTVTAYFTDKKPPIGIMPESIWKQHRAEGLIEAISRYVNARCYENHEQTLSKWLIELHCLIDDLADLTEDK